MSAPATTSDPARSSHYVTDALYAAIVEDFTDWQRDELLVNDLPVRDAARRLVEREARLLDQHRYENWLSLLSAECIYWIPGTPGAGDPRREIAVMFDDRRRLEDRIYRLRTGYAWSQAPISRTVRFVTNVEVFSTSVPDRHMVRCNVLIPEFWGDETRILSGWCGYKLAGRPGEWRIEAKQVNLIDCDQSIRNLSIIL
ncbi:MAG: aromatic-ring-hydroxylating dioxygenase subunit beta [Hyphomicrobiaceae bacterium]